jgi:drug/metabolite transporter (DMT)-like permease
MDKHSSLRGLLLIAGATFFWSLSGVFVRWLPGLDPWSFNAFRGLGLGLSMALWIVLRYGRGSVELLRRSPVQGLLISAAFFALGSSLYISALDLASVAAVSCLTATSGLFAALMARLWLGERTAPVFYLAMLLALAGVAVIATGEGDVRVQGLAGTATGLAVAACFAAQSVALRRYRSFDMEPAFLLGGFLTFAAICALGIVVVPPWQSIMLLLLMGLVQLAIPLVLYMHGARSVTTSHMVLITMADAVLNPLWVWLVHGEVPAFAVLIGGALVLGGIAMTAFASPAPRPQPVASES